MLRAVALNLRRAALLRPSSRLLSTRGPGGRNRQPSAAELQLDEDEKKVDQLIMEKLKQYTPSLRGPAPPAPTFLNESWVPAANVSPVPHENALEFRTRFYISSSGQQPDYASKVVLLVHCRQLGLSALELARLGSVADERFNRDTGVLRLASGRHKEPHKNKAELRKLLDMLLVDARENADAHAATPQDQLPLRDRERSYTLAYKKRANKGFCRRKETQAPQRLSAAFGPPLAPPPA